LSRTILSFAEGVHLVNEARNSRRKVAFAGKDIAKMSKLQRAVIDRPYNERSTLLSSRRCDFSGQIRIPDVQLSSTKWGMPFKIIRSASIANESSTKTK